MLCTTGNGLTTSYTSRIFVLVAGDKARASRGTSTGAKNDDLSLVPPNLSSLAPTGKVVWNWEFGTIPSLGGHNVLPSEGRIQTWGATVSKAIW